MSESWQWTHSTRSNSQIVLLVCCLNDVIGNNKDILMIFGIEIMNLILKNICHTYFSEETLP